MKKIHSYLLAIAALLVFAPGLSGQTTYNDLFEGLNFPADTSGFSEQSSIGFKKNISEPAGDKYWLKLEAYATGSAIATSKSVPADIILILDTSSSMDQSNYTYKGTSMKRWRALRAAVLEFVHTVYDLQKKNEGLDPQFKGNRIAIITYNRVARDITGGWLNLGSVVTKEGDTYSGSLIDIINTNSTSGVWANYNGQGGTDTSQPSTSGTRPDRGLRLAINNLLSGTTESTNKREDANLTVLLFTDGYPTDQQGSHLGEPTQDQNKFDLAFANNTLHYGSIMKAKGAKLYTVGLISDPTGTDAWRQRNYTRVLQMMDWLSSNYPDAEWQTTPDPEVDPYNLDYDIDITFNSSDPNDVHTSDIPAPFSNAWEVSGSSVTLNNFDYGEVSSDTDSEGNPIDYSTIVNDNTDFSTIFQTIASQSGGSAASTFTEESQAIDVMSSSFMLPDGTVAGDIKVFTAPYEWNSSAKKLEFGTAILAPGNTAEFEDFTIDEDGQKHSNGMVDVDDAIMEAGGITVDGGSVTVTGFDYADNWCGPVTSAAGDTTGAHGHKIIIMIPIVNDPDAVGGPNVATNGPGSGIKDKNGDMLVEFAPPAVALPVNIQIQTTGLSVGESAKYSIKRKVGDGDWEYVTSVFVTRHQGQGEDDASVYVKGLPPVCNEGEYTYKIESDDWDWSYTLVSVSGVRTDGETEPYGPDDEILTDNFAVNPIIFNNSKTEGLAPKVRYSESKATNTFNTGSDEYDDYKDNGRTVITVTSSSAAKRR